MKQEAILAVPQSLVEILEKIPRAAMGFSGGVDSSYLLYAAATCGVDVGAYYVDSQFQPAFELADARRLAGELGAEMIVIPLDVLSDETVRDNPADRCYHCKRMIFGTIMKQAAQDGYSLLMDGSNASDDAGDRPGMRALAELEVRSPLREAGLNKEDVRRYSREAGLFTWKKPAYACLATRIPAGTALTAEMLEKVERAETLLSQMGFSDLRVRVMDDRTARLQLPAAQLPLAAQRHQEILRALAPCFGAVLLDLNPR